MASKKKLLQAAAGSAGVGGPLNVEDVFSSYIYEGTQSTKTITNGLDLSADGGMVWIKNRDVGYKHCLFDTERGTTKLLSSNLTNANVTESGSITSFNSDGFTLGSWGVTNGSNERHCSWSFRQAPGFFDVVQYTGDGTSSHTINHNLGTTVGFIIIKRTDAVSNWSCYHRGLTDPRTYIELNKSDGQSSDTSFFPTAPTDTQFTVGSDGSINASGGSYVAYVFAHNNSDGTFGANEDLDIIKCGEFTGGSDQLVDLGWEAQWVLIKYISGAGQNWFIHDSTRGWTVDAEGQFTLEPNVIDTEDLGKDTASDRRGFRSINSTGGGKYIYIAIRKGTRIPEDATKVFDTLLWTGDGTYDRELSTYSFDNVYDIAMTKARNTTGGNQIHTRKARHSTTNVLNGMPTNETIVEMDNSGFQWPRESGILKIRPSGDTNYFNINSNTYVSNIWKQARGCFDIVGYTGDGGTNRVIEHNLGVTPEMMIFKNRTTAGTNWDTYHSALGPTKFTSINLSDIPGTNINRFNNTAPTATEFTVGNATRVNGSSDKLFAFLFATLDGVSKVGSFSHVQGTHTDVDCGFTNGARFVLLRYYDQISDWWYFDAERGINVGGEPRLRTNSNGADVSVDHIDSIPSGFRYDQGRGSGDILFLAFA